MRTKSDKTYRPQDDFYRYINHEWLDTYVLPPDKSRFGTFDKLAEQSDEDIHSILDPRLVQVTSGGFSWWL